MAANILSRFAAVLLDMNGTFMFDEDRFGPEQDYAGTYQALGGSRLAPHVVQETITVCCETLGTIYSDPERCDSFPQVLATLRALPATRGLSDTELQLLEQVIARHEVGRVPVPYAVALQSLARTHRLGLVANIWSRKDMYLQELTRGGVLDLFATTVFSSDGFSIKPSRKLFDQAVRALKVPRAEVVFVGDSLRHDVGGAGAAGLVTVWIDRICGGRLAGDPRPDFVVGDLRGLVGS